MKAPHSRKSHPIAIRILAAFALCFLAPIAAQADDLTWNQQTQSFTTGFKDESVTATYSFTNTSDVLVSVVETKASCGCTVPTLEKHDYQPGESGELKAIFTIGSRQGKQRKAITVLTENAAGESGSYELKLEVDIPIPVTLKPRVRFWKVSETAETQDIEILFHEQMPMNLTDLARKDSEEPSSFDYQIETITAGSHYRLSLTPKTPDLKSREVFYLQSDQDEKGMLRKFPIYAYVR
ncbi:conserved domain protein [Verrucomicrobiia bacterium DG1235]|nr:conserved domain protein [Verrucomicrobiae bacterium DG1235]